MIHSLYLFGLVLLFISRSGLAELADVVRALPAPSEDAWYENLHDLEGTGTEPRPTSQRRPRTISALREAVEALEKQKEARRKLVKRPLPAPAKALDAINQPAPNPTPPIPTNWVETSARALEGIGSCLEKGRVIEKMREGFLKKYEGKLAGFDNEKLRAISKAVQTGAKEATISELIALLGHPKFNNREFASDALSLLGDEGMEPLRLAEAQNKDAEIRNRAMRILGALDEPTRSEQAARKAETEEANREFQGVKQPKQTPFVPFQLDAEQRRENRYPHCLALALESYYKPFFYASYPSGIEPTGCANGRTK